MDGGREGGREGGSEGARERGRGKADNSFRSEMVTLYYIDLGVVRDPDISAFPSPLPSARRCHLH